MFLSLVCWRWNLLYPSWFGYFAELPFRLYILIEGGLTVDYDSWVLWIGWWRKKVRGHFRRILFSCMKTLLLTWTFLSETNKMANNCLEGRQCIHQTNSANQRNKQFAQSTFIHCQWVCVHNNRHTVTLTNYKPNSLKRLHVDNNIYTGRIFGTANEFFVCWQLLRGIQLPCHTYALTHTLKHTHTTQAELSARVWNFVQNWHSHLSIFRGYSDIRWNFAKNALWRVRVRLSVCVYGYGMMIVWPWNRKFNIDRSE